VSAPRVEAFYWPAITFSQTLGTAPGDWVADTRGLGYEGGALIFGAALLLMVALHALASVSRGAVLGRLHPDAAARGDRRRLSR
jgi:uncharacterized membrane-anchored protein